MIDHAAPLGRGTIFVVRALVHQPVPGDWRDEAFMLVGDWMVNGRLRLMTLSGYKGGAMTLCDIVPDVDGSVAVTSAGLLRQLAAFFRPIRSARFDPADVYLAEGSLEIVGA